MDKNFHGLKDRDLFGLMSLFSVDSFTHRRVHHGAKSLIGVVLFSTTKAQSLRERL